MDLKTFLVDNILEYTDRMSMATALEVRVPLLDTAFVEMSLNTPFAYKFRNGETKAILIDAFAEFFPPGARHAPKRGFNAPLALWTGKLFDPYFDASLVRSHPLRKRLGDDIGAAWNDGILDLIFIQQLRLQHRQGTRDNSHELFACILFDVWWRKYIKKSHLVANRRWSKTSCAHSQRSPDLFPLHRRRRPPHESPRPLAQACRTWAQRHGPVSEPGALGMVTCYRVHCKRRPWACSTQKMVFVAIYLPTLARYRVLTINPRVIRFCRVHLSQFDLVHFYGLYDFLGPVISQFSRRRGIPYVIEPMGMYRPIDRSIEMKKMWHRTIGGEFCRKAARVIATSELEQEELVESGVPREKIAIRHNGIDSDLSMAAYPRGGFRSQWGMSEDEPLILFLSRLIPRKGADLLIEAFAQASPTCWPSCDRRTRR